MRKIFINNPAAQDGRPPFWQPWGCAGCLWRTLLFAVTLWMMLFLMSMLYRACDSDHPQGGGSTPDLTDPYFHDPNLQDSINQIDPNIDPWPGDTIASDNDWLPRHPGGQPITPELPNDTANYIPPVENPIDSMGIQLSGDHLNVLISLKQTNDMEQEMAAWAQKFKQVYPQGDYAVNYYNPQTSFMQITVPESARESVKAEINGKMPEFDFIVFDEDVMGNEARPSDPAFAERGFCWWHEGVQLYEAWDITMGDPDIVIGVVDSFFDLRHPELRNKRIIAPMCFDRIQTDPTNLLPPPGCEERPFSHGTHVLSCAAADCNNNEGACGMAPKCSVIPVSINMGPKEGTTTLRIAEAILYCIMHGADVVNVSLGMNLQPFADLSNSEQVEVSKLLQTDVEKVMDYVHQVAERKNCMIVYAAGNEGAVAGIDPSKRGENTLRVSACGYRLDSVFFTNYGLLPEEGVNYSTVSFPGVDILGAMPNNKYALMAGTSQAAPLVSGVVALMKSLDRSLTNEEIINILIETGKPQPEEQHIGPLVQIKDALLRVQNRRPRMEDILADPSKLEGIWECQGDLVNDDTRVPIILYLNLRHGGGGTMYCNESGMIFESPLRWTVDTSAQKVSIRSTGGLRCPSNNNGYKQFICDGVADNDGTMRLKGTHPGQGNKVFEFKMSRRDRLNLTCVKCGKNTVL